MRVCLVRKWPLRVRIRFVCWNITRVSLWLLCNVHFVQNRQRTRLQDLQVLPELKPTDHCSSEEYRRTHVDACVQELEYRIDVRRVTSGAHIEHLQLSKKNFVGFLVAVNNTIKFGHLVFLL